MILHARSSRVLLLATLNLALLAIPILVRGASDRSAHVLFLVCATAFCIAESLAADETSLRQSELLPFAQLSSVGTLAVFVSAITSAAKTSHDLAAIATGTLLMLAGVTLRAIAIHTLGAAFRSTLALDVPRVQSGIYSIVAHPSELGLITINVGAAILFRSVAALALSTFVILPSCIVRMRRESRFLRELDA